MRRRGSDAEWWAGRWRSRPVYDATYTRSSQYLPMRDGVRIAVDLYLPLDRGENDRLPTILSQTRYHRRTAYRRPFGALFDRIDPFRERLRSIIENGYALVIVDVRGTGASFGSRPMEWSPDEVHDGVEVVDWIVGQPWSNGSVALTGVSYLGTAAEMLLAKGHPSVKAAHIRFALFDLFADAVSPGGVRCLPFLRAWSDLGKALDQNRAGSGSTGAMLARLYGSLNRGVAPVGGDDGGRLLQRAVASHSENYDVLANALSVEFRDDTSKTGVRFEQFSPHVFARDVAASGAAIYSWSSYYDGAFVTSAIKRFLNVRSPGARLVLGPWEHGGMQNPDPFGSGGRSRFDHTGEVLRYLERHIKGVDNGIDEEPPVHFYTMGEERWKAAETWPPPGFAPTTFHFNEDRSLTEAPPTGETDADTYRVDHSTGTGRQSRWVALVNVTGEKIGYPDRRKHDRKLLVYESKRLTRSMEVTGHPVVTLYVRSTASDGQFFVYLEDVDPNGRVHYITEGVFRAIHRHVSDASPPYRMPAGIPFHSFERRDAKPLIPGEVAELSFDLLPVSHLFAKGHAVRLAIAGADRDNFELLPDDPPQLEIMRNPRHASRIVLPVQFK